ncbi:hypothetical protein [Halodesulfovibrio marinisediminis]|uniref:Uncharacterized protein n=1 Tax=Halodesulfovibrio marinisediminis DSM 17456 TaxID=1121457 RepID=A0A1N6F7H3_9BACT|nr:hypothetical protein [Halodesulfovibrio marinisediminis]SIN91258.1 hypothetical protein SAMN02745161_1151 [Halodesulfovibrio marinisediminis DSM 17456]
MQAAALIPAPEAIPVAAGCLEGLLIVTFALHIILINSVLGGAIVCSVRSVVNKNSIAIKKIAKVLPSLFALAINLGVAPLLFIQILYGQYMYTSSILMAMYWLSVFFLAIFAYYALYVFAGRYGGHAKVSMSIFLSSVAMLCIGLVFSNNMTLMLRPDMWFAYFASSGGTLLNFGDQTVWPRYLHVVVASIAVGGLVLALVARHKIAKESEELAMQEERLGLNIFLITSLVQIMIGATLFFSLPEHLRHLFSGGSEFYTGALLVGLASVAMLLFQAAARNLYGTIITLVFTVLVMAGLRALVRKAMLDPYGGLAALPVETEVSPFLMFIVALVLGLGVIAYMINLAMRSSEEV